MNRRVVVTGIGATTPLGLSATETWNAACEGQSGIGDITLFDTKDCPVTFAGEVKSFDPTAPTGPFRPTEGLEVTQICHPKEVKKLGRFIHLSLAASFEAYADSGLDAIRSEIPAERFGSNIGVGMGGLPEIEESHAVLMTRGYRRVTPFLIPQIIPNMCSGYLGIQLHLQGPNICNVTACSSSAHAIGESYRIIQRGDADIMLSGGAECTISPLGIGGFASMKALSKRNDDPTRASRPFDSGRDGFVMAEGAAGIILEEYEFAKKRGAKIYGEVVGYGLSGDAHHMTLPAPQGAGGYRAMKMAIAGAGIAKEKIGYINAHGTSTPSGDAEEARAVAQLFPQASQHLHVSSTKSMTGHMLGAAGAVESVFCLKAMSDGIIPPTINLDNLDPECEKTQLDFVPNRAIKKELNYTMTNSFGFGGTNASLVFAKVTT